IAELSCTVHCIGAARVSCCAVSRELPFAASKCVSVLHIKLRGSPCQISRLGNGCPATQATVDTPEKAFLRARAAKFASERIKTRKQIKRLQQSRRRPQKKKKKRLN
ncbi:hypothetical protein V5799_024433, partial [Amblyomma americanum]